MSAAWRRHYFVARRLSGSTEDEKWIPEQGERAPVMGPDAFRAISMPAGLGG